MVSGFRRNSLLNLLTPISKGLAHAHVMSQKKSGLFDLRSKLWETLAAKKGQGARQNSRSREDGDWVCQSWDVARRSLATPL